MAAAVWAEHGIPRLHLIGGVVVGVQAMTGENVIDFSISFVLVHAHGAALFQCGLHIDPAFVFQYVRPRNGLENDAAFTAVGMFNDFGWNFWKRKSFLLSLNEWGMGIGDWGVKVLKFDGAIAPKVLKFDSGSAAEGCGGASKL